MDESAMAHRFSITAYLLVVISGVILCAGTVVMILLMRPNEDNWMLLIVTILLSVSSVASMLAFMESYDANQQAMMTHKIVNNRLTEWKVAFEALARAQGYREGQESKTIIK